MPCKSSPSQSRTQKMASNESPSQARFSPSTPPQSRCSSSVSISIQSSPSPAAAATATAKAEEAVAMTSGSYRNGGGGLKTSSRASGAFATPKASPKSRLSVSLAALRRIGFGSLGPSIGGLAAELSGSCCFTVLTQNRSLKATVLDANLTIVSSEAVHFDSELPHYKTKDGVYRDPVDNGRILSPTLMWVEALDLILDKL